MAGGVVDMNKNNVLFTDEGWMDILKFVGMDFKIMGLIYESENTWIYKKQYRFTHGSFYPSAEHLMIQILI